MPGSPTAPGRPGTRARAPVRVAFRDLKRVGTRDSTSFAAQWLACTLPCRRFAVTLAGANARLGAEVVSLHLPRGGLAPPTPCRSPGALRLNASYRTFGAQDVGDGINHLPAQADIQHRAADQLLAGGYCQGILQVPGRTDDVGALRPERLRDHICDHKIVLDHENATTRHRV